MLRVKTFLSKSSISGIGVFAAEDAPKGTVIWSYSPVFTTVITPEMLQRMSTAERMRLDTLNYYWIDSAGNYVISLDHDRFMNHAFTANVESIDDFTDVAIRDIKSGEELTIDYRTIIGVVRRGIA